MSKKRIQVYADEETKRRIEVAALKHNVAVTQYCLEAIKQQLAEDDVLEREQIEITIPVKAKPKHRAENLRALQEEIKASRGGELIDVDAIIQQMREERDYELLGMR